MVPVLRSRKANANANANAGTQGARIPPPAKKTKPLTENVAARSGMQPTESVCPNSEDKENFEPGLAERVKSGRRAATKMFRSSTTSGSGLSSTATLPSLEDTMMSGMGPGETLTLLPSPLKRRHTALSNDGTALWLSPPLKRQRAESESVVRGLASTEPRHPFTSQSTNHAHGPNTTNLNETPKALPSSQYGMLGPSITARQHHRNYLQQSRQSLNRLFGPESNSPVKSWGPGTFPTTGNGTGLPKPGGVSMALPPLQHMPAPSHPRAPVLTEPPRPRFAHLDFPNPLFQEALQIQRPEDFGRSSPRNQIALAAEERSAEWQARPEPTPSLAAVPEHSSSTSSLSSLYSSVLKGHHAHPAPTTEPVVSGYEADDEALLPDVQISTPLNHLSEIQVDTPLKHIQTANTSSIQKKRKGLVVLPISPAMAQRLREGDNPAIAPEPEAPEPSPVDNDPIDDMALTDEAFVGKVKSSLAAQSHRKTATFAKRHAGRLLHLLKLAAPPNETEALICSSEEAIKHFEAGSFFSGPIFVDGAQPKKLETVSNFLNEFYDDTLKVHVQDPAIKTAKKKSHVREVTIKQVREKFLDSSKRSNPWNCLELAAHVEDGLRPAFLGGEDCRLLTKLKLPSTGESASRRGYEPGFKEVEKWVLLAQAGSLTEPHQDSHGYNTYITVNQGIIGFGWLSNPTAAERKQWRAGPSNFSGGRWRYKILRPGTTVYFPTGTVHFVFRLPSAGDTLAFGGHVLRCSQIVNWVKTLIEEKANPDITNEDISVSAPAYLERVARFVKQARRLGQEEKWGGSQAIADFLRLKDEFMGN